MPRPTAAQLAYGSATVVFSTLAMLLLSQTRSGIGVAVISVAGLVLGLFVALTVPAPRTAGSRPTGTTAPSRTAAPAADETLTAHVPGPGATREREHSLRR